MKRYIKSSYEKNPKIYTEYNEKGEYIRQSEDAEMLIQDALEFGGCVVDENDLFVGGYEWVYNNILMDIFQDGGISPDYQMFQGNNPNTIVFTPYQYMFGLKEGDKRKYYADFLKDAKYNIYVNGKLLGNFSGVFRSFDDDYYYIEYWDSNDKPNSTMISKDTEFILEHTV